MDREEGDAFDALFADKDWCNFLYTTPLAEEYYSDGGKDHFGCRRPRNHKGDHWCPGQRDVEDQMNYIKQSLGITESETT